PGGRATPSRSRTGRRRRRRRGGTRSGRCPPGARRARWYGCGRSSRARSRASSARAREAAGCGPPAAPDGSRSRGSGCAARRAPPSPRRLGYDPSLPPVRDPSGRLAGGCDQPNEPRWVRCQEHPRRPRYASDMPDRATPPAPPPVPAQGPVLVLVAMPEEAAPLHARLDGAHELPTPFAAGVAARRGSLAGTDTLVVTTGAGIAAATAAAACAPPDAAPGGGGAAGSCGGLAAAGEVRTVIVGESVTCAIADATASGSAPGQVPGGPVRFEAAPAWVDAAEQAALRADGRGEGHGVRRGLMLSGDAFVTADLAARMRERFPRALSAAMETAGSARTAQALGVPFVALRAVSDLCGPAAGQQFHLELDVVAEISARGVEQLAAGLAG